MMKYLSALALLCSVFVVAVVHAEKPSEKNLEDYRAVMKKNCDNKEKLGGSYRDCIMKASEDGKFAYDTGKAKEDSGVDLKELCKTTENFNDGTEKLLNAIGKQENTNTNAKLAEAIKKSDEIIDGCKSEVEKAKSS